MILFRSMIKNTGIRIFVIRNQLSKIVIYVKG